MSFPARRHRSVRRPLPGFVLLEVLLSLTILAISVAAFMRSFTSSLKATSLMEVRTQAIFFADQLMDEFEIFPPASNEQSEGGFGDAYAEFSWSVDVEIISPKYRLRDEPDGIDQYFAMRNYTLEIRYDDGTKENGASALRLDSAIIGFEKFSQQSKLSYANY